MLRRACTVNFLLSLMSPSAVFSEPCLFSDAGYTGAKSSMAKPQGSPREVGVLLSNLRHGLLSSSSELLPLPSPGFPGEGPPSLSLRGDVNQHAWLMCAVSLQSLGSFPQRMGRRCNPCNHEPPYRRKVEAYGGDKHFTNT